MALTISAQDLDGQASGFDGFSIGKLAVWNVEITNTASFYNRTVYFNPALFLDKNLPFENTNTLPESGYAVTLPGAPGIVQGAVLPDTSLTNINYTCQFDLQTEFILKITLTFVFTEDIDNFTSTASLNPVDRFQKNTVNSPNRLVNDITPSVYNQERALRGHFVIGDISTGNVTDQITAEFLTQARWFEEGLTGSSPEYTDWSFTLEVGGEEVENLSAYDNATLKVLVDVGVTGIDIGFGELVVYREDISTNITDWVQATEMGIHDKPTLIFGNKDYVVSFLGWSLVAGTVYEGTFVLDASSIDPSGTYRIVVVAANGGNTITNSYQTTSIEATLLPLATTGTMAGEINDYNDVYTGNCLQVAPYERVELCSEVDKASYLTELTGKGLPGDFDTNFFSYTIRIYEAFGDQTLLLELNDKQEDPQLVINDTFNTYKACTIFRILPPYLNTAIIVDHVYNYKIDLPDNPYDDEVIFRQLINSRRTDEDIATTDELLTRISFFDGNNDPVIEICEDFVGPLRVEIEKGVTVPDYNLIAMIVPDLEGLDPNEQEDYTNNILEQLDADQIISVDVTFGVDNIANFTVDQNLLTLGQKYRVIAVAKEVNPSPPVQCPVINIQSDTDVLSVVTITDTDVTLDIDFAITNFAPSTVSTVDITTTTDPKTLGPNQTDNFVLDTGNYSYVITFPAGVALGPLIVIQDITVTLANGCTYEVTLNHQIFPQVGRLTNENEDVNAN